MTNTFPPIPNGFVTTNFEWDSSTQTWTTPVGQQFFQAQASLNAAQPAPPAPSLVWHSQPGSFYFDNSAYSSAFELRRAQLQSISNNHPWTKEKEEKLVQSLWSDWYGENWPGAGMNNWKYPELEYDKLETIPIRKHELRPFKIDYETYAEIKLRLQGTVISVKGHPFRVDKVSGTGGNFHLALHDGNKIWKVKYSDLRDLRTIPAVYTNQGWLCRFPARIYQQGINRHNTIIKSVDGVRGLHSFDSDSFLRTFPKRQDRKWDHSLSSLLHTEELASIRLSDDVAVKAAPKQNVIACYRGRELGVVKDNEVFVVDEDDLLQGWIEKSANKVGLELRAA